MTKLKMAQQVDQKAHAQQNGNINSGFLHPFGHEPDDNTRLTLYQMRKKTGISGAAAARMCNVSYRSILNWESGVTIPNIVNIYDLLHIYGYTLNQLELSLFFEASNVKANKQKQTDNNQVMLRRNKQRSQENTDTNRTE